MVPMPLDPPCTNMDFPADRVPGWNTLCHTVRAVSGSDAASTKDMPAGSGKQCAAFTAQYLEQIMAACHRCHHPLTCKATAVVCVWSRQRPLHVYVLSVATPIGERTHAVPNTPCRDTTVRAAGHVIPNVRHNPRDFEP